MEDIQGTNFVWRRSATDAEAVSLLVERFPHLLGSNQSEQNLAELGAFYAYGRLADEIIQHSSDSNFIRAAAGFINDLVLTNDPFLENLASLGVFEAIADKPGITAELSKYLGAKALLILQQLQE